MQINRYERPSEARFMNTYVPIPFEQLYKLGAEAKADVEKATSELGTALEKWSDFQSPSEIDTAAWYDETMGRAQPIVEELSQNLDMLKTAEGRAKLRGVINSVDRNKLATLKQSRDSLLLRQQVNQKLMLEGKYNPLWHDVDFKNYSTLNSGIYNDVSPLAYTSIKDLTDKYIDNMGESFLKTDGQFDYYGRTEEMIKNVLDVNRTGILSTPEARKHIETIMKLSPGTTVEQAEDEFMNKAFTDNSEYLITNRKENPYGVLARNEQMKLKVDGASADANHHTLIDRLAQDALNPGRGEVKPDGSYVKEISKYETYLNYVNPNSEASKAYSGSPVSDRPAYANEIISSFTQNIGASIQSIIHSEGDDKSIYLNTGDIGYPVRDGAQIYSEVYYMDYITSKDKSSLTSRNGFDKQFAADMATGKIPGSVYTYTTGMVSENLNPGAESSSNRGRLLVPISYFANMKYPGGSEEDKKLFESIRKEFQNLDYVRKSPDQEKREKLSYTFSKDWNTGKNPAINFIKDLGGELHVDEGRIISTSPSQGYNKDSDKISTGVDVGVANPAFSFMGFPRWGETTVDFAGFAGERYISLPVLRKVLNSSEKVMAANTHDHLKSNSGTAANKDFRAYNNANTYVRPIIGNTNNEEN